MEVLYPQCLHTSAHHWTGPEDQAYKAGRVEKEKPFPSAVVKLTDRPRITNALD